MGPLQLSFWPAVLSIALTRSLLRAPDRVHGHVPRMQRELAVLSWQRLSKKTVGHHLKAASETARARANKLQAEVRARQAAAEDDRTARAQSTTRSSRSELDGSLEQLRAAHSATLAALGRKHADAVGQLREDAERAASLAAAGAPAESMEEVRARREQGFARWLSSERDRAEAAKQRLGVQLQAGSSRDTGLADQLQRTSARLRDEEGRTDAARRQAASQAGAAGADETAEAEAVARSTAMAQTQWDTLRTLVLSLKAELERLTADTNAVLSQRNSVAESGPSAHSSSQQSAAGSNPRQAWAGIPIESAAPPAAGQPQVGERHTGISLVFSRPFFAKAVPPLVVLQDGGGGLRFGGESAESFSDEETDTESQSTDTSLLLFSALASLEETDLSISVGTRSTAKCPVMPPRMPLHGQFGRR